ncbi:MAG: preprotein translocase subunit YajC [Clostridia bacterium]|nr:preprotein translocase subunit YajC [Clostridia bacterium]
MFNFALNTQAASASSLVFPIVMIVLLIGMFWFTSRSNKKRARQEQEMRDSLAIGDEVTTIGGIIGKVVSVKDETFVLETTKDCTRIRFLKGAIRSVDVKAEDIAAAVAEANAEEAKDKEESK